MLQTQVNYWSNIETKRHNKAMEDLTGQEVAIKRHQSESQRMQAHAAQTSAAASYLAAQASMQQADAAYLNARTNVFNAKSQKVLRDEQILTEQKRRDQIDWQNLNTAADTQKTYAEIGESEAKAGYYKAQQAKAVTDSARNITGVIKDVWDIIGE